MTAKCALFRLLISGVLIRGAVHNLVLHAIGATPLPVIRYRSLWVRDIFWSVIQPAIRLECIGIWNLLWGVLIPVIWLRGLGIWNPGIIRMKQLEPQVEKD